ncbi:sulfurtransferase [Peribacillus deserti]|uniref:Sulfurtransferase n=1 Tax=Peribacillus deserti TaxID=673318 RepID=A0A2N5M994_9BACI|nr:sulfurtransferase [Peribacillus deserti]PLT30920.1 sulfurtransferase [Peribacillus deserti]
MLILILLVISLLPILYKRYYPVKGTACIENRIDLKHNDMTVLDIRDYNQRGTHSDEDSINIPYAYLYRYYGEIPYRKLHLIASDKLEYRLGIRFLRAKGFDVSSYMLTKCPCKEVESNGV